MLRPADKSSCTTKVLHMVLRYTCSCSSELGCSLADDIKLCFLLSSGNVKTTKLCVSTHNTVNMSTNEDSGAFKCTLCTKSFEQQEHLDLHIKWHNGCRPYSCKECGAKMKYKGSLTVHMKLHNTERPYKCLNCEKSFSKYSYLERHLRVHTADKPHPCDVCEKTFRARPFICTECKKSFRYRSNLA
ncbi:zinc finger 271-like isoform X1, partial [Paramuricea clavata]